MDRKQQSFCEPETAHTDLLRQLVSNDNREKLLHYINQITNIAQLDKAAHDIVVMLSNGELTDNDYLALQTAISALRSAFKRLPVKSYHSRFTTRQRPRMPQGEAEKLKYMTRRRELAAQGYIPAKFARHFTQGQLAALAVIVQEIGTRGYCALVIEKIAALAGVSHATVRRAVAVAKACSDKLLSVEERPRKGRKNLSNIIRINSRDLLAWISRRFQKSETPAKPKFSFKEVLTNTAKSIFLQPENQKCYPMLHTNIFNSFLLKVDPVNMELSNHIKRSNKLLLPVEPDKSIVGLLK